MTICPTRSRSDSEASVRSTHSRCWEESGVLIETGPVTGVDGLGFVPMLTGGEHPTMPMKSAATIDRRAWLVISCKA
jgi:hypothetical protein